jgi:hypothetical protein
MILDLLRIIKIKEKLTPKAWFSGKKTGIESERFRVRAPLMCLEGGKCNYIVSVL